MAASKSIASAQFVEEAAAIVLVARAPRGALESTTAHCHCCGWGCVLERGVERALPSVRIGAIYALAAGDLDKLKLQTPHTACTRKITLYAHAQRTVS